jgi:8-oxo-dGTP pyrophosphatase MutT (NUDIX family)
MNFDEFLISIANLHEKPLPAESSQFKMSPPYRQQLIDLQREKMKSAKNSAVLALFYPDAQQNTKLMLMLRKTYKGVHSAQIGFPGGKREKEDTSLQMTALRETEEEIGVPRQQIEVLKALSPLYIPPSNFNVFPFIGICRNQPIFTKEESEVEDLIEVTLTDVFDNSNIVTKRVKTSYNIEVEVPAYKLNEHLVWGATAMMLSEIKDLLKEVL